MGILRSISALSEKMTVEFDEGRFVEYEFDELDQLELCYAVTIHKAQGSEYPAVVIPLLRGPRMLMNRNLLYTAVTRAKQLVVLIGDPEVMNEMIDNTTEAKRYTSLNLYLCTAAEDKSQDPSQESAFAAQEGEMKTAGGRFEEDDPLAAANFRQDWIDPDNPFAGLD